mgnify:CR=1 FL=1
MSDNAEDKKETREHLKKYRFTQTELDQIDVVLKKTGWTLTDFFRTALQSEIQKHYFFVPTLNQIQGRYVKKHKQPNFKVKTIKRYVDTDPNLLLALGRIGNNLNQVAKALNIIYKDPNAIAKFSFLSFLIFAIPPLDYEAMLPQRLLKYHNLRNWVITFRNSDN